VVVLENLRVPEVELGHKMSQRLHQNDSEIRALGLLQGRKHLGEQAYDRLGFLVLATLLLLDLLPVSLTLPQQHKVDPLRLDVQESAVEDLLRQVEELIRLL
jgi:hypothetical protein